MADISGVAVANQHDEIFPGGVGVAGEIPAMQFDSVRRVKVHVLKWTPEFVARRNQDPVGMINLAMFEPTQH